MRQFPTPVSRNPEIPKSRNPDHRMIRFDNVSKRYASGHDALAELNFEIDAGEVVFVTGHSGAGKSTLLKLISLAERPTRGQITVNHADLARVRRGGIAH